MRKIADRPEQAAEQAANFAMETATILGLVVDELRTLQPRGEDGYAMSCARLRELDDRLERLRAQIFIASALRGIK